MSEYIADSWYLDAVKTAPLELVLRHTKDGGYASYATFRAEVENFQTQCIMFGAISEQQKAKVMSKIRDHFQKTIGITSIDINYDQLVAGRWEVREGHCRIYVA